MHLPGRNYRQGLTGNGVRTLHSELAVLGYGIPSMEWEDSYFGPGTRTAVVQFQVGHGLRAAGDVDAATAVVSSAAMLVGIPRLVVLEPSEHAGEVLVLSRPEMVIRRSNMAGLVLDDRYPRGRQALVLVDRGEVTIRDLNSTGRTFVNDERLVGLRALQPGDLVRFCPVRCRQGACNRRYRDAAASSAGRPSAPGGSSLCRSAARPLGPPGREAVDGSTRMVTRTVSGTPAVSSLAMRLVTRRGQ
jgi:hypothetical protein